MQQQCALRPLSPLQETLILPHSSFHVFCGRSSRRGFRTSSKTESLFPNSNLRKLTSRIVELTRRKQLHQILEEVEMGKKRHGKLNIIVMNAVVEACVRCGDVESALLIFEEMSDPEGCGVDSVTYATLLKGMGEARRIDEAFQILESVEQGTAAGSPKLSSQLIYGLLNALLGAGDMRRANGLLARYRLVLHEEGHSILLYNLLMKGYTNTDFPLGALAVRDELLRHGLKPDRLSYNTLIFACVKSGRMDTAIELFDEMKEEARKVSDNEFFPDAVTYTTLLKGLGNSKDVLLIQKIVVEMKSLPDLFIDRVAYTAIVDALLACGLTKGALCIFGEILKRAGENTNLKPKPHLYLAIMREFAVKGDFNMVKKLHARMWLDSIGSISPAAQCEADELLMEAAANDNQLLVARKILFNIIKRREWTSWTSRGRMVAVRMEALSGFTNSLFSPYILYQVSLGDPVEKFMTSFEQSNPLHASLDLKKVVMRFYRDTVVPVIDDWGSCVGIVHREDCNELSAPLWRMTRGPPPCVTPSTSIGRVIDLLLDKKLKMVIVVRAGNVYETTYSSCSRPVGVFTYEQLFKLTTAPTELPDEPSISTVFAQNT